MKYKFVNSKILNNHSMKPSRTAGRVIRAIQKKALEVANGNYYYSAEYDNHNCTTRFINELNYNAYLEYVRFTQNKA